MGNKTAWSQNMVRVPEAGGVVSVTGTRLHVPDSYGVCPITAASGQNVDIIDTEWALGRVIEFFVLPGSSAVTFRDNQTGTNIVVNGLTQACPELSSIQFRAWRDANGNKMWYQITSVFSISA